MRHRCCHMLLHLPLPLPLHCALAALASLAALAALAALATVDLGGMGYAASAEGSSRSFTGVSIAIHCTDVRRSWPSRKPSTIKHNYII